MMHQTLIDHEPYCMQAIPFRIWLEQIGGVGAIVRQQSDWQDIPDQLSGYILREKRILFVSLLMTIFSQSLFPLVRRNFVTLSLFTTRHKLKKFV
jgi:hypothetical protein